MEVDINYDVEVFYRFEFSFLENWVLCLFKMYRSWFYYFNMVIGESCWEYFLIFDMDFLVSKYLVLW